MPGPGILFLLTLGDAMNVVIRMHGLRDICGKILSRHLCGASKGLAFSYCELLPSSFGEEQSQRCNNPCTCGP